MESPGALGEAQRGEAERGEGQRGGGEAEQAGEGDQEAAPDCHQDQGRGGGGHHHQLTQETQERGQVREIPEIGRLVYAAFILLQR